MRKLMEAVRLVSEDGHEDAAVTNEAEAHQVLSAALDHVAEAQSLLNKIASADIAAAHPAYDISQKIDDIISMMHTLWAEELYDADSYRDYEEDPS